MVSASSSIAWPLRVYVDGAHSARDQVSLVVDGGIGEVIYFAVFKVPGPTVSLELRDAGGQAVLGPESVPTGDLPELWFPDVFEVIERTPDRLKILRLLIQDCVSLLDLAGSDGFEALYAAAIQQLRVFATPKTARSYLALPPLFGLLTFDDAADGETGGTAVDGVQAVQFIDPARGRITSSPFKPIRHGQPNGAGGMDLLVECGDIDPSGLELILWASDGNVFRISVAGAARLTSADLLPLIRERGAEDPALIGYLAAGLVPYRAAHPEYERLLREVTVLAPTAGIRTLESTSPIGVGIDTALVSEDGDFLYSGWVFDPHGLIKTIVWLQPGGGVVPVLEHACRVAPRTLPERYCKDPHGDHAYGFVGALKVSRAAATVPQHRFEAWLGSGARASLVAPPMPLSPDDARGAALSVVDDEEMLRDDVWEKVSGAVASFHRQHLAAERVTREVEIGETLAKPRNSLIIPLYKALEFIRFQFAAFRGDRDFASTELIFVLDSPEQDEDVEMRLRAMVGLYGLPARLIVHDRNLGFAPAVNTGVARARGATVIALNSDILPSAPGWIGRMRRHLKGDVGVVGPKLLFHDDSIQHAGMTFAKDLRGRFFNQHPYKGFPRDFAAANIRCDVPALTGACLVMKRETFEAVGGISEDYVVGDFEDADFSLKIRAMGKRLVYEPAAELYHYERQSIGQHDTYTKTRAGAYNRKLHGARWLDTLAREALDADLDTETSSTGSG